MLVFVFWFFFALLVGFYASSKGRSDIGFFFIALLLSPLIGFIIAAAVQPIHKNVEATAIASGEHKKCPYCAELVKMEAVICKHCGSALAPESVEDQGLGPIDELPEQRGSIRRGVVRVLAITVFTIAATAVLIAVMSRV